MAVLKLKLKHKRDGVNSKYVWTPRAPVASSYEYYTDMMRYVWDSKIVTVGQEWEYNPRSDNPQFMNIIDTTSYIGTYVKAYRTRHWHDGSGPNENFVPVVQLYSDSAGYNIESLLMQAAFMALSMLPHDECGICGRHIHLAIRQDGRWTTEKFHSVRIPPKIHELMWAMAGRWAYRDGVYTHFFRPAVARYSHANDRITYNHYDAININTGDGKLPTIEVRYGEVITLVALPALIYFVEYFFKGNKSVLDVSHNTDEYFDKAAKLCNNPMCSEVIRSLRDYVKDKKNVKWTWIDIRNALGHLLDNALYALIDAVEDDRDNLLKIDVDAQLVFSGYVADVVHVDRYVKQVSGDEVDLEIRYVEMKMEEVVRAYANDRIPQLLV